ncbi:dTTP/UTP pyrophosphatase isoform X2 [Cylas formicarius]|uniref:dTTP/UTP pyrophosphatase isoform X2 n=1 Tax=Cylas formicarius TaxID=197179 RepID=UPI002958D8E5|nr:dTTP/UTP pyrophosphatase isoform X2 [Cylas formicarius]
MLEPLLGKLNNMRVVLASGSKQRANLLSSTNLNFEVVPSNYEEDLDPREHTFSDFVENTALASDTMVVYNGKMFGKPKTREEAIKTISELTKAGLPNFVYTGVIIWYKNKIHKFTEVTTVHMAHLTDAEILAYIDTGEHIGKAGGYGIQGIASTFVTRIEGDCNNVIGLPLCKLAFTLKNILNNS